MAGVWCDAVRRQEVLEKAGATARGGQGETFFFGIRGEEEGFIGKAFAIHVFRVLYWCCQYVHFPTKNLHGIHL